MNKNKQSKRKSPNESKLLNCSRERKKISTRAELHTHTKHITKMKQKERIARTHTHSKCTPRIWQNKEQHKNELKITEGRIKQ